MPLLDETINLLVREHGKPAVVDAVTKVAFDGHCNAEVANLFALFPRGQVLSALRRHFEDEVAFNAAVRAQPTQKESDDEWLAALQTFCEAELPKDKKRRAPVPHEYVLRLIREIQAVTRVAKQFHGECVDLKKGLPNGLPDELPPGR